MNKDFIFKFGKYSSRTYGWVMENDPSYIIWCKNKAPNLLKEVKVKSVVTTNLIKTKEDIVESVLQPNLNFLLDPPDKESLKYRKNEKEN